MKTIQDCSKANWDQVLPYVNKAVVFVDNVTAELLHWQGGLLKLLKAGALNVKELSSFESGTVDEKKGVFMISSPLEGVTRQILRDIIQASHFQYVVVLTSVTSGIHNYSITGSVEENQTFYDQVEDRLLEWMGNMNYTAEVFHVPLFTVSLDNSVFITPGYAGLFPLISSDLHQVELQFNSQHSKAEIKDFGDNLKDLDFASLPKDLQVLYKRFISSLDSLLGDLGVKEDIYSIGTTSGLLATELESYPAAKLRRKNQSSRASVVLIDRSLDLSSVTCHNTDTLLDRILQVMPRLPGHVTDVQIDMTPLCKVHSSVGGSTISPGCLATTDGSQSNLHSLIIGKQKEALMDVNRQLVEAAASCNLPLSLKGKPTRVTHEQLDATLTLFKGKYKEISDNLDAIQVAMATSQTLSSPRMQHCDELISVEKGLLQSVADQDCSGALSQICQMVQKKIEDKSRWLYSIDNVLCMLVYLYSLAGQDILENEDEESLIQAALVDRIMEEKNQLSPIIKAIVGEGVCERSIVSDIVEDMWEKLYSLATARQHCTQFKNVLDPGSAVSLASQNSLCKQLMEAVLDPAKPDLVDLEFKSSGLKDMLKAGFGLFRSVAKPRPSDHPLLILFIIGGVTSSEVKHIKDVVNQYKPSTQVVVGSTRLLSPSDVVKSILCQNNVNPDV